MMTNLAHRLSTNLIGLLTYQYVYISDNGVIKRRFNYWCFVKPKAKYEKRRLN